MRLLTFGLAASLVVGLSGLATRADEDREVVEARQAILDLAKDVAVGKDITKKVAALRKKVDDLGDLMHVYKPRRRGGIGYGPKPTYGLEYKIRELANKKRELSQATVKKEAPELLRLGYINLVMAEITRASAPEAPAGKWNKKQWNRDVDAMKRASLDLIKAIKAGDPAAVKAAATRLDNSCVSCH